MQQQAENHLSQLREVAKHVDAVEQRHNEVVDVYARFGSGKKDAVFELQAHIAALHTQLTELQEHIHSRLLQAKRATVLLSLLGQQEEFAPVLTRVQAQQYELYVDKKWFLARLENTFGSSNSDT